MNLRNAAKIAGLFAAVTPADEAESAPFSFKFRGKTVQGIKNFSLPEAESFVKEMGGARALQKGTETIAWPLYPWHEATEDALDMYGARRLVFEKPQEMKWMAKENPNLFRSMYTPVAAMSLKNKLMAEEQALEESYLDPAEMIAAAASGGGTIGLRALQALADPAIRYLSDKVPEWGMNTESGI